MENKLNWLGSHLVKGSDLSKEIPVEEALADAKLLLIIYTASWWPGCAPFKANIKKMSETWDAENYGVKIVLVSGDKNVGDFEKTLSGYENFYAIPWTKISD